VDAACDGQQALTPRYDVLVVDRGLPTIDGLDLWGLLRPRAIATPALVLSAIATPADRVAGFNAGVEAYLGKPFDISELPVPTAALRRRHRGRHATRTSCSPPRPADARGSRTREARPSLTPTSTTCGASWAATVHGRGFPLGRPCGAPPSGTLRGCAGPPGGWGCGSRRPSRWCCPHSRSWWWLRYSAARRSVILENLLLAADRDGDHAIPFDLGSLAEDVTVALVHTIVDRDLASLSAP
jgi:CheY-like chemotaxis protein